MTDSVISALTDDSANVDAIVDAGLIIESELVDLFNDAEKLEVADAADPMAKAIEIALANYKTEFVNLLKRDVNALVEAIGAETLLNAVGAETVMNTVGTDAIVSAVGADVIVDTIGADVLVDTIGVDTLIDVVTLDTIIETVGLDTIIETVGLDTIIETVGLDTIIETVGLDAIIETVGLDAIIETVGLDTIIETVGLDTIIETVGLDTIIETVGLDKIIETVGLDKIIETVGIEKIINTIGINSFLNAVGIDNVINSVLKYCPELVTELIQKAFQSPSFDIKAIFDRVNKNALKTELVNLIIRLLVSQVETVKLATATNGSESSVAIYESSVYDARWNFNDMITQLLASIPTVETLETITSGETLFDLAIVTSFFTSASEAGLRIVINVEGDTTAVNTYADKLFSILTYAIETDNTVGVVIDDEKSEAPLTFAYILTKALETDKLSDAKKAELFSIFTKTGNDMISALKTLNLDFAAEFLPASVVPHLNTIRDTAVKALEKAMTYAPAYYAETSLAELYDANAHAFFAEAGADVSVDTVIEKLCGVLGMDSAMFKDNFVYDTTVGGAVALTLAMKDVYRVRYYDVDGSLLYTTFLPAGADMTVIIDNTAALAGKAPYGWKTADGAEASAIMPAEDTDLYVSLTREYTVYFDPNGGQGAMDPMNAVYGNEFKLNANTFTYEGYRFIGWNTKADGTGVSYDDAATVKNLTEEGSVTLYAQWVKLNQFVATFVADGEIVAKVVFEEGDTALKYVPRVPNKTGYYGKWEKYTLANRDIVIEAIYTAKTYTVRYDANGGEGVMAIDIFAYDLNEYLAANAYTREGYVFAGWNTEKDGSGFTYADKALVRNLTDLNGIVLYAQWTKLAANEHVATFVADGSIVATIIFKDGDTELTNVPAVPAKAGYTGAWSAYTLGNTDITVTAVYTANTYTVVFDANGGQGTMVAQNMTFGVSSKLNANIFTNGDAEFLGWNTKADGTGTAYADGATVVNVAEEGTVTLYAQWKETSTETTTDETTTVVPGTSDTTTVPGGFDDESGFPWVGVAIGAAVVAAIGGVVGFLIWKKKRL